MRQIKFRGKAIKGDKWCHGDFEYNPQKRIARIHTYHEDGSYNRQHIVRIETIGQFTGLLDKDGKEIYEGDIFSLTQFCIMVVWNNYEGRYNLIRHNDNQWVLPLDTRFTKYYAVIGNIHDNPELMKGGKA